MFQCQQHKLGTRADYDTDQYSFVPYSSFFEGRTLDIIDEKMMAIKNQQKLQKRLAQAKLEANDPAAKKVKHLGNFDPSILTADPSTSNVPATARLEADLDNDPFASYFTSTEDPSVPPKILITTGPKASKPTYEFCDELVGVFPGAEFIRRKKGKGFEMGRIAGWAADRGYKHLCVVNEDMKKPNAITLVHLPNGPSAYFKLTSIELTKQIFVRTCTRNPSFPRTCLNGFVTRLDHIPPLPEFQGRQVVTLHNQRDFLFFRRHRYAFRSTEKVALQEIGPRFTLKLRWMKKGIPAVYNYGEDAKPLAFDTLPTEGVEASTGPSEEAVPKKTIPPKQDEFIWAWKPELETSRKTFFL
ncbi:anticodon-binding protein [Pholiota molesta]|nr:anticodon-binding protein [Pholiota molesta]